MMFSRTLAVSSLLAALHLCSAAPGFAQHTEREPLLTYPPIVDHQTEHDQQTLNHLRDRLEELGQPGFAFYWGQWLSADYQEQEQQVIEGTLDRHQQSSPRFDPRHGDYWHASSSSSERVRLVARREAFSASRATELGQAELWRVESAFVGSLNQAQLRLVDPELVTRLQSSSEPDQGDRRRLETAALLDRARFVLEVLGRKDELSETGWLFRVRVTDLADGKRLIDFSTNAAPVRRSLPPIVATERGFERAAPEPISAHDVGTTLATQLMVRLNQFL